MINIESKIADLQAVVELLNEREEELLERIGHMQKKLGSLRKQRDRIYNEISELKQIIEKN